MMSVKDQLYYLIKHVKLGDYDINTFCDMFTNLVNLEMWKEEFTEKETTGKTRGRFYRLGAT